MTAEASSPASIEAVAERLADLGDLFRRRLLNDRLQRELYETLCKRLEEADGVLATQAVAPVLRQIVMVIDRIEAAGEGDPTVESIRDELLEILARQGVVRLPLTEGKRFDPRWHFAVGGSPDPADEGDGTIVKEVRSGYLMAGEVLRPADVEVAGAQPPRVALNAAASYTVNSESTESMEGKMGRGLKCRECQWPMYADKEDYQPKGTWVVYVCMNAYCPSVKRGYPYKEKVFEPSRN